MNRYTCYMPASDGSDEGRDLFYVEESARDRSLHLLLQDTSLRESGARVRFLKAAYRDVVAGYLRTRRPETAATFLRDVVRTLDMLARSVDTRLDNYSDLGVFVLVRESNAFHLLCTRSASARLRENGVFVPLNPATVAWVVEVPIETTRSQRDLFTPTLPESLALYYMGAGGRGESRVEWLLGGDADDAGAAIDSLDLRPQAREPMVTSERVRHAVLYAAFDPPTVRREVGVPAVAQGRRSVPMRRATWVASAMLLVAVAVGLAVTKPWSAQRGASERRHELASQERALALDERSTTAEPEPVEEPSAPPATRGDSDAAPPPAADDGFRVKWEKEYGAAVTSSPSALGNSVVFGARDGKVYALDRASGEKVWTHTAAGGVGASPVVRNDVVIAADYAGTVVKLSRDGRAVWKRALREKIVSTPAIDGVRVVVGTMSGNVYALSLETGRVLWKFRARGQIRGAIARARDTVFVPSQDGRLYALADDTGAKRWAVALGGPVTSSPATDGSAVVVGTAGGDVVALEAATGRKRWTVSTRGAVNSGVTIDGGRVYVGSADRTLYCLALAGGDVVWKAKTAGAILSKPFVGEGLVVVTAYDHRVYCFEAASGDPVDQFETTEAIFSSPVVIEGRVYFGNNDGRFYCLETPRS